MVKTIKEKPTLENIGELVFTVKSYAILSEKYGDLKAIHEKLGEAYAYGIYADLLAAMQDKYTLEDFYALRIYELSDMAPTAYTAFCAGFKRTVPVGESTTPNENAPI
ncbi:hypothetical protein AGMMS49975_24740 [Clostridia bacterium]|nr:hypothetical protein AGMMS49975_24740 [Clostridia bacterium]